MTSSRMRLYQEEESAVHTAEDIDNQEAKGTIHDPNYHDEDQEEYVAAPNQKISLLAQDNFEQRENENENDIAKKDGSVVHTAEDIDN
eukprot:2636236-Ditylum_brightwellii.AAC.1